MVVVSFVPHDETRCQTDATRRVASTTRNSAKPLKTGTKLDIPDPET
jgi:hypothetical protein